MLKVIILSAIQNRFLVLLLTLIVTAWGVVSIQQTPLDAIPDLSDVQVIIKTSVPGQAPQVVEDQVTYPITTTMLSVPKTTDVRGYSFFGDSYVYVLFEDGTDLYWARARVLEYLNQAASQLPDGIQPSIGPDATGVGWVYQYALLDRSGTHDLSQLRSLQDWFLRYELQTVQGVAEVASVGGMVRQYQVVVNPNRLRALNISLSTVSKALKEANREVGGSVLELGEAEYMVRAKGYLDGIDSIKSVPVSVSPDGVPILISDLADVRLGPELRRGISELDGEGEVVGGIVVMRFGENALDVIERVKERLEELKNGLPEGVEIVETYDRSELINHSVDNLTEKLIEEFIVVALVCLVFLFHLRSAFVAIVSLPLGVLIAFIVMNAQGINANIMSLGGIAIAIGAMVDAAIVMIENAHKHLEQFQHRENRSPSAQEHWKIIAEASIEVGPALFFSLLIITLSFIPVFALEAQEGRLFTPLAFTKTYAMAAAAGLSVTLIPVLMGYFVRGKIPSENDNPISRFLIAIYQPALRLLLKRPLWLVAGSLLVVASISLPYSRLGSEFMPSMDEGDLFYMPTTLPALSIGEAGEILQQTDRLIKTIPEVERVFGKIGRADTATDPAPLTMIETMIQLKPRDEWRDGMDLDGVIAELDQTVNFPGLTNAWVQPIKTRIDMLATGIKTPVGIKVAGTDFKTIEAIGKRIEEVLSDVPGTASVYSERVAGGRYIEIVPDRIRAARYGLNLNEIHDVVATAVGGQNVTETVEGLERYPVNVRFPRSWRDDLDRLAELPLVTPAGAHITLGQVADIAITDGPPMIKTENARLNGWTFVDIRGADLGSYVEQAKAIVNEQVELPAGYSITWAGQYEYLLRVQEKMTLLIPLSLMIIFILLYLTFRSVTQALMVLFTLPFALAGGYWLIWVLGYSMSVAVAVGFIALAGVAAEFGVVMLVYLDNALKDAQGRGALNTEDDLLRAIMHGAVQRVRPKAMTVAVILAGLLPIMFSGGAGSEVMQRIAAPMIGGMITAPVLSLFLIPVLYWLWKRQQLFNGHLKPAA